MQYKWTALWVTTVGIVMAGIDTRIVVIGLPTIAAQLHADAEEAVWIGQAYLLAGTVCLLFIGRISDLFGKVKIYNVGFIILTVGSVFCALAGTPFELIVSRVAQGIGYAIIVVNSSAIITDATPKGELGTMLGVNVTAWRMGSIMGLSLSGFILSVLDWRGLFYINIPIGIFGTVWAYRALREAGTKDTSKKMDWAGFALFAIGLTLVLLAITYLTYGISGTAGGYALLFAGFILIALFFKAESKARFPLLDLRLFRIRLFTAGNLAQLMNGLVFSGFTLLAAFYLQIGLGYTPLESGLALLPLEGTYLVLSLIGGTLSDKYGSRALSSIGLVVTLLGILYTASFTTKTQYNEVAFALGVVGVGNGLFTSPNTRAIMGSVPANRRGIASGFRTTMYNVGFTASYGLVILFITLGVPYGTLSSLLQGSIVNSLAQAEFVNGCRVASIILALVEGVAIIPSAMRGPKEVQVPVGVQERRGQ